MTLNADMALDGFFWGLGCGTRGSPGNHTPRLAPQIEPTPPARVNPLATAVRAVLPVA